MCLVSSIFDLPIPFLLFLVFFVPLKGDGLVLDGNSQKNVKSKTTNLPAIKGNKLQNHQIIQDFEKKRHLISFFFWGKETVKFVGFFFWVIPSLSAWPLKLSLGTLAHLLQAITREFSYSSRAVTLQYSTSNKLLRAVTKRSW